MQADLLSHFSLLEDSRIDRTKRYPLVAKTASPTSAY